MGKQVICYLNDDDMRILDMCEAAGLIRNRSEWLRQCLYAFAEEKGLDQAFAQEIEAQKERLAFLEALRSKTIKVEIDRQLCWQKICKQFYAHRSWGDRVADMNWLRSRKRELKVVRPGKSLDEVLVEILEEEKEYADKGVVSSRAWR